MIHMNFVLSKRFLVNAAGALTVIHLAGSLLGWYKTSAWFDIALHVLWGWMIAVIFILVARNKISMSGPFFLLCMMGVGALFAVGWELFEFAFDYLIAARGWADYAQKGLDDTMSDLFWQVAGSALGLIKIKKHAQ